MKDYLRPSTITEDSAGRKLDAAGKLVIQSSRPELKKTKGVDPKRRPEFVTSVARNGNS